MKGIKQCIEESLYNSQVQKIKDKEREGNDVVSAYNDLIKSGHGGKLKSNKNIKILHDPALYPNNLEIEYNGKEYWIVMRGDALWIKKLVFYDPENDDDIYVEDKFRYREDTLVKNLKEKEIVDIIVNNIK